MVAAMIGVETWSSETVQYLEADFLMLSCSELVMNVDLGLFGRRASLRAQAASSFASAQCPTTFFFGCERVTSKISRCPCWAKSVAITSTCGTKDIQNTEKEACRKGTKCPENDRKKHAHFHVRKSLA